MGQPVRWQKVTSAMRVEEFDYPLDDSRIAHRPLARREQAKLLLSTAQAAATDYQVADLPGLLTANDLLIFNNTKVIPARLYGQRGMARIELLLHRARPDGLWEAFARPMKRLHNDDRIIFAEGFSADVLGRVEDRVVLNFNTGSRTLGACLEAHGHMPLPPYIKRADDASDRADYQTVFAAREGAVAAPTASLHFTKDLMAQLPCPHSFVTLHVGAGTFQPVRVDDTRDHVMHSEWADVSAETIAAIAACKAAGGRVIAIGTTALRALESSGGQPFTGDTDIFITPGYRFKVVDGLMTNFHLPKSTLLMLVAAFVGMERMKAIYQHALTQDYRFFSYGDTSLLFPEQSR